MIIAILILTIVVMWVVGLILYIACAQADHDKAYREYHKEQHRDDMENVIGLHGVD